MELEGRKGLVDTGKSSRTWSVPTLSLRLAVLNGFQGFFGPKMAVSGPKLQLLKLRSATCESRSRPPPLSFLLKLCVIVLHTHRYHPPYFHLNLKHHDGDLIFPHFARALLAAACCCLLLAAAKPGRSTLDPKKGYKTKTGSTSSVTLTLTKFILTEGSPPSRPHWTANLPCRAPCISRNMRIQQHKMSLPPLPTTTLAIVINWVQRMGQILRHGEKVLQIVW